MTRNHVMSLENQNATVDTLVHDARNPLNALSISLEILTERIRRLPDGATDRGFARCLHSMRDSIHRLDEVLQIIADTCEVPESTAALRPKRRNSSEW